MAENKRHVMVIEDDRFLSTVIKARLEKGGLRITQAFDGEEALTLLKKDPPNLIILDLIMPKATGFEVLKVISSSETLKKIPVVILSHLAQASDIQKARELGATEYFVKVKVSIDDLVKKVEDLTR